MTAVWVLAAIVTKRTVYHESGARRLRYVIPAVIGWFLLFRGHRLAPPLSVAVIPETDAILIVSSILCVCGVGFCVWARAAPGGSKSLVGPLTRAD